MTTRPSPNGSDDTSDRSNDDRGDEAASQSDTDSTDAVQTDICNGLDWVARRAHSAWRSPFTPVVLVGLVVTAINIWWFHHYRAPGSLEVDETGYLATALRYHRASTTDFSQLVVAIGTQTSGPVVPALAVPLMWVFGRSFYVAQAIQSVLHIVGAVAVTGIIGHFTTKRVATISGIVTMTLPALITLDRSFQLATGAGVFLCLAVWALLSSRRGDRRLPMVLFGLTTAGMVMSRTMAIGFVPGLAAAVLINTRWTRRALLNLFTAAAACMMTAGVWWILGWDGIMGYLVRSGYSEFAEYWGPNGILDRLLKRMAQTAHAIRFPYILLALASVVVGLSTRRRPSDPDRAADERRGLLAVGIVVVVGYATLLTTANTGTWFELPLDMVGVAGIGALVGRPTSGDDPELVSHDVAVEAAKSTGPSRSVRAARISLGVLALCIAVTTVVVSTLPPTGRNNNRANHFCLSFFSDTDHMLTGNFDADPRAESPNRALRAQSAAEWLHANEQIVAMIHRHNVKGRTTIQQITGSGHLFNVNTLLLAGELTDHTDLSFEIPITFEPETSLREWLKPTVDANPRVIVHARLNSLPFPDDRFPDRYDELVDELGWQVVDSVALPDGSRAELLVHPENEHGARNGAGGMANSTSGNGSGKGD